MQLKLIPGLGGLDALGMGSANFMELQQRMQTEMLRNPEMLRTILDNPLVQSMLNDPNSMRSLIMSNPQMQDLIEVNKFHLNFFLLIKVTKISVLTPQLFSCIYDVCTTITSEWFN